MYFSSTVVIFSAVSAVTALTSGQRLSKIAIEGIFGRQLDTCVPVTAPATCERSCGPGNIQCIKFPTCYNPSAGDTCCSDGKYCPSGYYCTDAGCCPSGTALGDCGATISLSVVPPPAPTTVAPIPSVRPTSTKEVTRTPESTTSSKSTTSKTSTTSSSEIIDDATPTSSSISPTSLRSVSSSTSRGTTSNPPLAGVAPSATSTSVQNSLNAASKLGTDGLLLVFGGIGALMMAL